MKKAVSILLVLVFCSLFFTSCYDLKEVEQLAVVAGCAIDKGTSKKYHLTVELVGITGDAKSPQPKSTLVESEGNTIFEAQRNMTARIENRMYWSNCQVIIFGKEVAFEGIGNALDFFKRDHEPRPTIEVLISNETTGKEILNQKSILSKINSFAIDVIYENLSKTLGTVQYLQLYQVLNTLEGKGKALTLPLLRIVPNNKENAVELSGVSIFKDDRMIGFLSPEDTRYFDFTEDLKGGILTLSVGDKTKGKVTLEVYDNKTSIKSSYKNKKLKIEISTVTTVSASDIETESAILKETNRKNLTRILESQLSANITRVIRNVQASYGVDIYGFGTIVSKQNPKLWKEIHSSWEEIFPDLFVTVKSKINIRNSYLTR